MHADWLSPDAIQAIRWLNRQTASIEWLKLFPDAKLGPGIRERLGTKHPGCVFHAIRHGAATHGVGTLGWDLTVLKQQGRWDSDCGPKTYMHAAGETFDPAAPLTPFHSAVADVRDEILKDLTLENSMRD